MTPNELGDDSQASPKAIYVMKSQLLGVFAKYAVQQSPYHRPDNLERVLDRLNEALSFWFDDAPLGVMKIKDWQTLESELGKVLADIPEYVAWNERKNGRQSPMQFTSRYDKGTDPDDDFIDLDALTRNVATEIEREHL